ncbi:MAG TPA: ABC transporter substrate-binding protein [Actinomycetota bacterium]|nr:ABC transporter substrate-binding protein [Actinomycetota bacterium]
MRKLHAVLIVLLLLLAPSCSPAQQEEAAPDQENQEGFSPVNEGVLTVATNLPAPGFWNGDDPSQITGGFEYGIAQELAKRLNLDGVRVVNVSFDALVAGQAKDFDVAFSQVTITDERAEVVDFTEPYYSSDQGVMVRRGTRVPDLAAAKRLRWGVQASTTGQTFVEEQIEPEAEALVYSETTQAFTALQANQVDAVLLDTAIVLGQASQPGSPFEVVGQFRSGEAYGGVLPKGSANLEEINRHLKAMVDDGTVSRLGDQFLAPQFGSDPAKVPYIEVG